MNVDIHEKLAARIKELEEAMPDPFTLRRISDNILWGVISADDGDSVREMADRIEKVMKSTDSHASSSPPPGH